MRCQKVMAGRHQAPPSDCVRGECYRSSAPGTIPVTLDISGMYSNEPWTDGMTAFEEAMNKRDKQNIPTSFLLSLVMLVLSCNFFFDGVLFLQLFGVVMGTKGVPTFACSFRGWLELKMLGD